MHSISAVQFGTEPFVLAASSEKLPDHAVQIEGKLIHLGEQNLAKWGVNATGADQIIKGIHGVPIRACKALDPHECDYAFDTTSQIGYGVRAWIEDGWIHAAAAITDKDAAQKIRDGTWTPFGNGNWSVAGLPTKPATDFETTGMVDGFQPTGISLVFAPATPAFEGSGFNMVAAAIMENDNMENEYIVSAAVWTTAFINGLPDSSFAYVESCYGKTSDNKNMRHLPYKDANGKIDLAHLRAALARVNQIKPICPADKAKSSAIISATRSKLQAALTKAKGAVGAAIMDDNMENNEGGGGDPVMYTQEQLDMKIKEALEAKIAEIDTAGKMTLAEELAQQKIELESKMDKMTTEERATYEAKLAEMIPKPDVEKMVAAAVTQAQADTLEAIERDKLLTEYQKMLTASVVLGAPYKKDGTLDNDRLDAKIAAMKDMKVAAITQMIDEAKIMAAAAAPAQSAFDATQVPGQSPGTSSDTELLADMDAMDAATGQVR